MNVLAEPVATAVRVVSLGEAVELNPRADRGQLSDDLEVSFVPMAAVEAATGRMDASTVRRFGEVKKGYTIFREGDVLFAKITPCMENGKITVARGLRNGVGCGSTEFHVLRPRPGVDPHYVYYFVSSGQFRARAAHHMTGAVGQRRVPVTFLEQSEIALPSLIEQRRIVAELEKQLSRLEEAGASLARSTKGVTAYRACLLEAAVRGQLLSEAAPTSTPLNELIGPIHQGWSPKCDLNREPDPEEWAVITTTAVQPMRYVDNQGKSLPADLEPRPRLEIQPGDFLVTRKGPRARAGVACLVRRTRQKLMVCDTVYRFRCDESKVVPQYLEIALNAPSVVHAIDRQKAGINESGVSLTHQKLRGIDIPLPKLGSQHRIVAEVDRRLSIVREVEAEVVANLKRAQALRERVLASAFSRASGARLIGAAGGASA